MFFITNYLKKNKSFGTLKELLLFLTACRSFFHCIQFEPFLRKSLKVWFFQGNPSIHAKVKRDDRGQFWESQLKMRRRDADADVDLATLGAPGCLCSDFTGTGSHQRTTFSLSQIPGRAVGEGGEVGASCADTHAQMHCVWYSGNSVGRNFLQSMSTLSLKIDYTF